MKLCRQITFLLVITLALVLPLAVVHAEEGGDVNLTFQKAASGEGTWAGTVDGDVQGNLETVLLNIDNSNPVWDVEFDWIIDAGDRSFTTRMTGTLNSETGAVEMDGEVIEGWMLGARVHEEGQMVDPETSTFEGFIELHADDMAPETLPVTGGGISGHTLGSHWRCSVCWVRACSGVSSVLTGSLMSVQLWRRPGLGLLLTLWIMLSTALPTDAAGAGQMKPDAAQLDDVPVSLSIPHIDLETLIVPVGWHEENGRRVWDVPADAAGWHLGSGHVGERSNLVISGHNNTGGSVFQNFGEFGGWRHSIYWHASRRQAVHRHQQGHPPCACTAIGRAAIGKCPLDRRLSRRTHYIDHLLSRMQQHPSPGTGRQAGWRFHPVSHLAAWSVRRVRTFRGRRHHTVENERSLFVTRSIQLS